MDKGKVKPIRKRMQRWEGTGAVRFVTFSCQRRLPLLGHPAIRDVFAEHLAMARTDHGFELYAWVVMPEHVHLIMRPRKGTELADALHSLKTSVAKRVVARWKELRAPVLEELRTSRRGGTTLREPLRASGVGGDRLCGLAGASEPRPRTGIGGAAASLPWVVRHLRGRRLVSLW